MARVKSRHGRARTCATLGVAGAVALGPFPATIGPVLAQEASSALEPVAISIGTTAEFTRVEFAGVIGRRSRIRQEGQKVIVRIGTTAAPDVSRLKVDTPTALEKVETRAVAGGTELVLTLAEGATMRTGTADRAVYLNLYDPAQSTTGALRREPTAGQTVPVEIAATAARLKLDFAWTAPVGAAVFRRGEAVWIVFDTPAKLNLPASSQSGTGLGPATAAHWVSGKDYTALRIAAPQNLPVSANGSGGVWSIEIGGVATGGTGVDVRRDDQSSTTLIATMAGATHTVWLTDPVVGDRFAAVTALAPGKGVGVRRSSLDMTLLPTAQGLAVETLRDDLSVRADGDLVTLSRPGGLTLSAPLVGLEAATAAADTPAKADYPGLVLEQWADTGSEGFQARYRRLHDAAAQETIEANDNLRTPITARLGLARFLVGSGLAYEAIGMVDLMIDQNPGLVGEAELRGLRGAARAMVGRLDEAAVDFSAGSLAGDPSTRVWLGYLASRQGDWETARREFAAGAVAIDKFPTQWRTRFATAHALAALETSDLEAAKSLLAYAFAQNAPSPDQLEARLVQARLFEATGEGDRALAVYKAVARAPLDGIATPASLGAVKLELDRGTMKPDVAAAELESLKWRWRGDATELAVIRTLGGLYLSQGRYREALDSLRGAGQRLSRLPGSAELQADLGNAFRALFLDGAADGLQPVQALALFYDFRELTPIGADGDEMVRRLTRRLVDVDLLNPAAELLKHQVDERLEGVAKAQVATDLATIYLMDRQAEKALQAIWSSRTTLLPSALNAERRALEARALMDLGRYDHALEVLDRDATPDALDVRAEIFWKQENWAGAARIYETRLGDRFEDTATALSADEESRLTRTGVGYSLAGDTSSLSRLSRNYLPFVARARSSAALKIAMDGPDSGAAVSDFAGLTAGADTFAGWVQTMKADFRKQTGGTSPAATTRS